MIFTHSIKLSAMFRKQQQELQSHLPNLGRAYQRLTKYTLTSLVLLMVKVLPLTVKPLNFSRTTDIVRSHSHSPEQKIKCSQLSLQVLELKISQLITKVQVGRLLLRTQTKPIAITTSHVPLFLPFLQSHVLEQHSA